MDVVSKNSLRSLGKHVHADKNSKYGELLNKFGRYLTDQVEENGYIKASAYYRPYTPHWIRDASFISMSLLNLSNFVHRTDINLAGVAFKAAERINTFNINVIENHFEVLKSTVRMPYEDENHYQLVSHVPARVGKDMRPYCDDNMNDATQYNRWLMQHDTVPLALMAIGESRKITGMSERYKNFITSKSLTITRYLDKIAITPSSDLWEMETDYIHSYTVSSIFSGKKALLEILSGEFPNLLASYERTMENNSQIIDMLRMHISDKVVYRRKMPWQGPDVAAGVDASQIFMFSRFGIGDTELGYGIEENTIEKIENDLFSGNLLPIRNSGDVYFTGGRWLLLGLEYAKYLADSGKPWKAMGIIDNVIKNYSDSMPEQVIINPAHPESEAGKKDLDRNGGLAIQHLNWTYAAAIDAMIAIIKAEHRGGEHGLSKEMFEILRRIDHSQQIE